MFWYVNWNIQWIRLTESFGIPPRAAIWVTSWFFSYVSTIFCGCRRLSVRENDGSLLCCMRCGRLYSCYYIQSGICPCIAGCHWSILVSKSGIKFIGSCIWAGANSFPCIGWTREGTSESRSSYLIVWSSDLRPLVYFWNVLPNASLTVSSSAYIYVSVRWRLKSYGTRWASTPMVTCAAVVNYSWLNANL